MKYVSWNTSKINEQISVLKRLYRQTRSKDILFDIQMLEEARERSVQPFEVIGSFRDRLIEENIAIRNNIPFLEDVSTFSELDSILQRDLIDFEDTYRISVKDLFTFIHDFYRDLDPEIARIFFKIFKERRDNLKFIQGRGVTYTTDKLRYSYIAISKNDVVGDYINAVHEYAHAIADRIHYRYNYYSSYPFIELMPLLMEFLACDKMMKDFDNVSKDVTGYKASELDDLIQSARQIDMMARYMKILKYSPKNIPRKKREFIGDMMLKLGTGREEVLDVLDLTTLERLSYLIPYMTAIELYYLYKNNPELALRTLKEIITLPDQENYNIALMDREIYLNDHSKKLTLDINKDLERFK